MARKKAITSPAAREAGAREAAKLLKMASDPTRLQILLVLADRGEVHVGGLCENVHQTQPAVAHHLILLRLSGMVSPRREGLKTYYSLSERGKSLANVVQALMG